MTDEPTTAEPQKPRRRWFQFRLRTLLIAVTFESILCPLGVRYFQERQQRMADAKERRIEIGQAILSTYSGAQRNK